MVYTTPSTRRRRGRTFPCLILGSLVLSACNTPQVLGVTSTVVTERRAMNDAQARITLDLLCDISVGAKNRVLSAEQRRLVEANCGGVEEPQIIVLPGVLPMEDAL